MKFTRTLALVATITLIFTACGKDDEQSVALKENANPLLTYVPADAHVVLANLEPVPKDITDAYVNRAQPVIDEMNQAITNFQAEYAAGNMEGDPKALFASAVLDELGGSLSVENLERLGISLQSHKVVYTMGVFPVVRIELTDAAELRAAIGRIEAKMGISLPVSQSNGTNYWRFADSDSPVGVYISILDNHLAVSTFPVAAEDQMLAAFLGQELPSASMASSNALAILNKEKGYSAHGSGFINIQNLVNEIFDSNSMTRSYLGPEVTAQLDSVDAICITEARAMIAKAPRMTAGTVNLTANEMTMRYEWEIANPLAAGLAALVSNVPPAIEGDFLISASLALQVGKLRNFILEKANEIVAAPYQCEQLQSLNSNAQQVATQLNIPMPPMVNNLEGIRVKMDDFDPAAGLNQGNGLVALHVDKPEMFVGMANMMVPGFDALDLANQTEPVKLPRDIIQMPDLDVYALMGKNSIGAAIGGQFAGDLKEFMNVDTKNDGTFFSVSYDMAKQMKLQEPIRQYSGAGLPAMQKYAEAIRESYIQTLGRSRVDMRFTNNGLVIDSMMTFK